MEHFLLQSILFNKYYQQTNLDESDLFSGGGQILIAAFSFSDFFWDVLVGLVPEGLLAVLDESEG